MRTLALKTHPVQEKKAAFRTVQTASLYAMTAVLVSRKKCVGLSRLTFIRY